MHDVICLSLRVSFMIPESDLKLKSPKIYSCLLGGRIDTLKKREFVSILPKPKPKPKPKQEGGGKFTDLL